MSGVQVDAIWGCTKSVSKHPGEENSKKCGSQDTTLLFSTVNLEGFKYFSIKANSAMHVYMKRCNDAQNFRWASYFLKWLEQPSPVDHVKGFGQVNKGKTKRLLLFPAVLLQFSDRKIISTVDLPDLKPHWDSGYIQYASICSLARTTCVNTANNA